MFECNTVIFFDSASDPADVGINFFGTAPCVPVNGLTFGCFADVFPRISGGGKTAEQQKKYCENEIIK
jgi:hypothetical protein